MNKYDLIEFLCQRFERGKKVRCSYVQETTYKPTHTTYGKYPYNKQVEQWETRERLPFFASQSFEVQTNRPKTLWLSFSDNWQFYEDKAVWHEIFDGQNMVMETTCTIYF